MGIMDRFKKKTTTIPAPAKAKTVSVPRKEAAVSDKKVTAEKSLAAPSASTSASAMAYRVIVKPLVTEKSAVLQSQNQYTFVVANWASKQHIKEAVRALYQVTPVAVNVVNMQGHKTHFGRSLGKRSDFKKAIVTLAPGQSIVVHQGV